MGECPRPRDKVSPEFTLHGVGPFRLVFSPNGDTRSGQNQCSLALRGPAGIKIWVELSVDKHMQDFRDLYEVSEGMGYHDFKSPSGDQPVLLKVRVKELVGYSKS